MKKVSVELTFATGGQYENAKPTIEVEVPEDLDPVGQYFFLYDMFHNIQEKRPSHNQTDTPKNTKWGKLQARAEGFDMDNDPYLDGDQDEGSRIENATAHRVATGN